MAGYKKSPRKRWVPGGQRTPNFPGAIGSDNGNCAAAAVSVVGEVFEADASLLADVTLRGPQKHNRSGCAPNADSPPRGVSPDFMLVTGCVGHGRLPDGAGE